jgi:hypothetical protein
MNSLTDLDIVELFNKNKSNFLDTVGCLVYLSFHYGIPKKKFKDLKIIFCDRTFRRRMKSFLEGDGEGKKV